MRVCVCSHVQPRHTSYLSNLICLRVFLPNMYVCVWVCVRVCICMRAYRPNKQLPLDIDWLSICMCVRMCVCMCVCVCVCVCVCLCVCSQSIPVTCHWVLARPQTRLRVQVVSLLQKSPTKEPYIYSTKEPYIHSVKELIYTVPHSPKRSTKEPCTNSTKEPYIHSARELYMQCLIRKRYSHKSPI